MDSTSFRTIEKRYLVSCFWFGFVFESGMLMSLVG